MDSQGIITSLNPAAERILAVDGESLVRRHYGQALPVLEGIIAPLIRSLNRQEQPRSGYEVQVTIPRRGPLVLKVWGSKVGNEQHKEFALVFEDLTEQRGLESQVRQLRNTFERYFPPHVAEHLLSDPSQVRLGGVQQEVTILFADVRGFAAFGERVSPTFQLDVLNRHLAYITEAVLAEGGTLDKFMGDAVMVIFNAPILQDDHPFRAVRAAVMMQRALAELHATISPEERLEFGVGISTGEAAVGNIGAPQIHTYTAIGDVVNTAYMLQAQARGGQILVSASTYASVQDMIVGAELGPIQLKGHCQPDLVFEVLGLTEAMGRP